MNLIRRTLRCIVPMLLCAIGTQAQTVHVMFTTDTHGAIFPYDLVRDRTANNTLAKVCTYVEAVRDTAENTILLDGGDFLQGTPVVHYYNYLDTIQPNIVAEVFNFMQYDAVCIGNHDIEAGHPIYDRLRKQLHAPVLGANVVSTRTKQPYFRPYTVVERAGKRIAIIGLTTPHVPHWLPEYLWAGMDFEDMIESARKWIEVVREREMPDAIIGMFHSGFDYTYGKMTADTYKNENASQLVANRVEGFDAVLIGHDHRALCTKVPTPTDSVCICNSGYGAAFVSHLTLQFADDSLAACNAELIDARKLPASEKFMQKFAAQLQTTKEYAEKRIATVKEPIYAYESLFGPATFTDIVHRTQMRHTDADISFSAPLFINASIEPGDVSIGKMFNIYRYENKLCTIELTGEEVKNYLEYSYDMWIDNPLQTGHLLKLNDRGRLANVYYNFDSAAGIDYTVDPCRPYGERVDIRRMADGTPFDPKKTYRVAMNSYRCTGGGGLLEFGAGIAHDKIADRIVATTEENIRDMISFDIAEDGFIDTKPYSTWRFANAKRYKKAIETDRKTFKNISNH